MAIEPSERTNSVDAAISCFGMAYVLNRRAVILNHSTLALRFSGLLGVALVGIVVILTPGSQGDFTWVAWIAGLLSAINFIASLVSMNWSWDQRYHGYMESIRENNWLSGEFDGLFRDSSLSDQRWRSKLEELKTIDSRRKQNDASVHISEKEKHLGYRAGLLQFQLTCGSCGAVPKDMNPTNCHSCGQIK